MRKKISAILFYFFFLISCLLIPLIYLYVTLNINAAKNTSLSVSSVSAAQKQDTTTPSDTSGAPSDKTDRQDIPDTEVPMKEMTTVDAEYIDAMPPFIVIRVSVSMIWKTKKLWWTVSERSVSLIF